LDSSSIRILPHVDSSCIRNIPTTVLAVATAGIFVTRYMRVSLFVSGVLHSVDSSR
jgi:hypothetical protein